MSCVMFLLYLSAVTFFGSLTSRAGFSQGLNCTYHRIDAEIESASKPLREFEEPVKFRVLTFGAGVLSSLMVVDVREFPCCSTIFIGRSSYRIFSPLEAFAICSIAFQTEHFFLDMKSTCPTPVHLCCTVMRKPDGRAGESWICLLRCCRPDRAQAVNSYDTILIAL